MKKGRPVATI
jgi:PhoH-like ATPase